MSLQKHQDEARDWEEGLMRGLGNIAPDTSSPVILEVENGGCCSALCGEAEDGAVASRCQGLAIFLLQVKEGVFVPLCGQHIPHVPQPPRCTHEWGEFSDLPPYSAPCLKCGSKKRNPRYEELADTAANEARRKVRGY